MKYIILFAMICTAFLASSCNDWLDVKPQMQVETEDLFQKPKGFEDALVSCYIKLNQNSLYGKNMTMTVVEYLAQFWNYSAGNYREEEKLKDFDYSTDYARETMEEIYAALYNTIVQANVILENLEKSGHVIKEKALRQLIEAEALGIRAFCHTDVLRLFGQIPQGATIQVKLPYAKTVSTDMIPYYSYDNFLQLILDDINAAERLLKESDPIMTYTFSAMNDFTSSSSEVEVSSPFFGYRRFRINYYAMEALKARLCRYAGKASEAYEAAMNVINGKAENGEPVLTLAGSGDFNQGYNALPNDCIFALNNTSLKDYVSNLFTKSALFLTTKSFENDLFAGQTTNNNRYSNIWKRTTDSQGTEYYAFRKYKQPENGNDGLISYYNVIPLIRLSEMYLIAMESTTDPNEANTLYKEYMRSHTVPVENTLTPEQLQEEIMKEYRREFFGEGQMFYTYKRLKTAKMMWKNNREVTEKDYIVPLPDTELGL